MLPIVLKLFTLWFTENFPCLKSTKFTKLMHSEFSLGTFHALPSNKTEIFAILNEITTSEYRVLIIYSQRVTTSPFERPARSLEHFPQSNNSDSLSNSTHDITHQTFSPFPLADNYAWIVTFNLVRIRHKGLV